MSWPTKCSQCGGSNLELGNVLSYGPAVFKPETGSRKFFTITAGVKIAGVACYDCGALQLVIDPAKLVDSTGRDERAG
jgi:hypothetical protein